MKMVWQDHRYNFVLNIHKWKAKVTSSNMYWVAQAENFIFYISLKLLSTSVLWLHIQVLIPEGAGLEFVDNECWCITC